MCQDGVTFLDVGNGNVTIPRSGPDHGTSEVSEAMVGVTEVCSGYASGGGVARLRMSGSEAGGLLARMADGSSGGWFASNSRWFASNAVSNAAGATIKCSTGCHTVSGGTSFHKVSPIYTSTRLT